MPKRHFNPRVHGGAISASPDMLITCVSWQASKSTLPDPSCAACGGHVDIDAPALIETSDGELHIAALSTMHAYGTRSA